MTNGPAFVVWVFYRSALTEDSIISARSAVVRDTCFPRNENTTQGDLRSLSSLETDENNLYLASELESREQKEEKDNIAHDLSIVAEEPGVVNSDQIVDTDVRAALSTVWTPKNARSYHLDDGNTRPCHGHHLENKTKRQRGTPTSITAHLANKTAEMACLAIAVLSKMILVIYRTLLRPRGRKPTQQNRGHEPAQHALGVQNVTIRLSNTVPKKCDKEQSSRVNDQLERASNLISGVLVANDVLTFNIR